MPFHNELRERYAAQGVDGISRCRDWWLQIGAIGTLDDDVEHLALLEAAGLTAATLSPAPGSRWPRQIDDVIAVAAAR